MSMIGHNGGPTIEAGYGWRKHVWTKARADLLPKLPLEVLKRRVKRAKELGLPYKTYAGIRASTGRDVIAFLFSQNGLEMRRGKVPEDRVMQLDSLRQVDRVGLLTRANDLPLDAVYAPPTLLHSWSETQERVKSILTERKLPGDAVVLVGETRVEAEWVAAGGLASFLTGERYFSAGERG